MKDDCQDVPTLTKLAIGRLIDPVTRWNVCITKDLVGYAVLSWLLHQFVMFALNKHISWTCGHCDRTDDITHSHEITAYQSTSGI